MYTRDKLHVRCPHCDKGIRVSPQYAGKRGKCPGCGGEIRIPLLEPEPAPVLEVLPVEEALEVLPIGEAKPPASTRSLGPRDSDPVMAAPAVVAAQAWKAEAVVEITTMELPRYVSQSYTNLRVGMGVLALLLPLILWAGGLAWDNTPLQTSVCAYYYTPMRNVFVGIMFAIGTFLYLYKGFSRKENYALNLAGIFAILIALVPTDPPSEVHVAPSRAAQLHSVFAALFVFTAAGLCIFLSSTTLKYVLSRRQYTFYTVAYKLIGLCMATIPVAVYVLANRHQRDRPLHKQSVIFFAEVTSLCVFGVYWLLKSKEISDSEADWLTKAPELAGVSRSHATADR